MTTGCCKIVISFCLALIPAICFAQFEVPQSQLDYTKTELDKCQAQLAKEISELNYKDPGKGSGWQLSQTAWESMARPTGYPPKGLKKSLAIEPERRTELQQQAIRKHYLAFVHQPTVNRLRPLAERVDWLNAHLLSGKSGLASPWRHHLLKMFWLRRLVDTYRATTDEKPKFQKKVISFLDRAANNLAGRDPLDNIAGRGHLDNQTAKQCRQCIEEGCTDPVFLAISNHTYVITSSNHKALFWPAWKRLPSVINSLADPKYPRLIEMLARMGQCRLAIKKSKALELEPSFHDKLETQYHHSIVSALQEESGCPENLDPLIRLPRFLNNNFRKDWHQRTLYETLAESNLPTGTKLFAMQQTCRSWGSRNDGEDSLQLAIEHGEAAAKETPLSLTVIDQLVQDYSRRRDVDGYMKWFEVGSRSAPRNIRLYESTFAALSFSGDPEKHEEFLLKILASKDYDAGVPWFAFGLMNTQARTTQKFAITKNKKVIRAMESKLKTAAGEGHDTETLKPRRQLLVYLMLEADMFTDALRVASDLDGDFGDFKFQRQKITFDRIAKLNDTFTAKIQKDIDDGTFDVTTAEETVNKLSMIRMDMDPGTGLYIDELVDLLTAIEDFHAGKWADLTPSAQYLSGWKGRAIEKWIPVDNGIRVSDNNSGPRHNLYWRHVLSDPYIIEVDIEVVPHKHMKAKRGAEAGIATTRCFSGGRNVVPKFKYLINPPLEVAEAKDFREKPIPVKGMINKTGTNRVGMRVWENYLEFTLNGHLISQHCIDTDFPHHPILLKSNGTAQVFFRHVRIKRLDLPPPVGENQHSLEYWTDRLASEPNSRDVQHSLVRASIKSGNPIDPDSIPAADPDPEEQRPEIKAPHSPRRIYQQVEVLKELGQIQRAIKKSRQIVFDFPDNSWRFCQLALLLAHGDTPSTDDLDLAIGYTKKAIEHYPLKERAKLHELWAVLQAKRGYFEAAVKRQEFAINQIKKQKHAEPLRSTLEKIKQRDVPQLKSVSYYCDKYTTIADSYGDAPINRKPLEVEDGLVAMWTFDQDTRESLTGDASAEQLDAKIVEAKVGGGLLLSETNTSNLITPEGEALVDLNEAWTICFWLYRESDDGSLLAQAGGLGELNVELSDKDIFMHLFTDRQRSVFIGKTPIAKSKWQHIAITSDGTNQREGVNVFVDGKKIDVYRASNNNPDSHPAKVPVPTINFGACFDERTGFTAHSIIDEMRFYEVELLPENIVKVMGNQ